MTNLQIPRSVANANMEPLVYPGSGGMPFRETIHFFVDDSALKTQFGADGYEVPGVYLPKTGEVFRGYEKNPADHWIASKYAGRTVDGWDHHVLTIPLQYAPDTLRNPPGVRPFLEVNTPEGPKTFWLGNYDEELKPNGSTR